MALLAEETCFGCDGEHPVTHQDDDGTPWCDRCAERRRDAAHAQFVSDFYGGSEPVTADERHAAYAREKRRW